MRKTAIVLGGTYAHIELIRNLRKRGYYTILIDYLDFPPAKEFADKHIKESTLNKDKVLEIALESKADLVISTCIDQANVTACYVGERLKLPVPYNYETSLIVTNKRLMKKFLFQNNIPTAKYLLVESFNKKEKVNIKYPIVIKPSDSTGSKGVYKIDNESDLSCRIDEAFYFSRDRTVIIEEYIEGKEFQVDYFISNYQIQRILVKEKRKAKIKSETVLQSEGSIISPKLDVMIITKIDEIARNLVNLLKIKNSPLVIQCIANKTEFFVIEFAIRVGGGLSYSMIKQITGFDIIDASIESFLGDTQLLPIYAPQNYWATHLFYSKPGIFGSIDGLKNLKNRNIIEAFYLFKSKGDEIGRKQASSDRVAAVLIKGDIQDEVDYKIRKCIEEVKIYDVYGDCMVL